MICANVHLFILSKCLLVSKEYVAQCGISPEFASISTENGVKGIKLLHSNIQRRNTTWELGPGHNLKSINYGGSYKGFDAHFIYELDSITAQITACMDVSIYLSTCIYDIVFKFDVIVG